MTNCTFTYHATTKELQYEDIRINATAMNFPDEDDGKEFVEGVDFNYVNLKDIGGLIDEIWAYPIQKQESEDELWWELLKIFKRPFAEKNNIEKAKQNFTIKRK